MNEPHGTGSMVEAHVGFCLTDDDTAAERYAVLNDSDAPTLHEVTINTTGLTVAEVEYDYDGCEPVLGGCAADVAEYLDCDEMGRTNGGGHNEPCPLSPQSSDQDA